MQTATKNGTTKTKEETLDKIRKLLRLTESPNENEAALAASMAQEMLDRHNLKMAEVSELRGGEKIVDQGRDLKEEGNPLAWFKPKWQFYQYEITLFCGLARLYNCSPYIETMWVVNKTGRMVKRMALRVIGYPTDIEVFSYTLQFLLQELRRTFCIDAKSITKTTERERYERAYGWGFATKILTRLKKERDVRREAMTNETTALVLVQRSGEVEKWVKENRNFKPSHIGGFRNTLNDSAWAKGQERGAQVQLRQGVAGSNKTPKKIN